MLKTELKLPFIWYNDVTKQHRFRPQGDNNKPYCLICGNSALLPFQIKRPTPAEADDITEFKLLTLDGEEAINLIAQISLIEVKHSETDEYLTYKGDAFISTTIATGCYYAMIKKGDDYYYSELITVVSDLSQYIKIEWFNSGDIDPVLYQTGFKNVVYLDTYTEAIPPELNEEGEENGAGEFVPTLQRIVHKHKIEFFAPDYLLDALAFMQIHDSITITDYVDSSEMQRTKVTSDYGEYDKGSCKIEFELPGDYIRTNCARNIALID